MQDKKRKNKLTIELIKFLEEKSNNGQNSIAIPLKKKRKNFNSFQIHPIYKNFKICGINVERRVMPIDTVFPIEIFEYVIELLLKTDNFTLENGDALKFKMGELGLHESTIEYVVAKKFYSKNDRDSADRRISVISNILIASGLCESRPSSLKLNLK
jgi:hypothetical protein